MQLSNLPEYIRTVINKFPDVFYEGIGTMLTEKVHLQILDKKPFRGPIYPIPDIYLDEVQKMIEEMEELGIIEKSPTDYINPLVIQEKKDGKLRICLVTLTNLHR